MAGRAEGKVAVVNGGASGIGRAVVKLLVAEGAKVVIGDIGEANGRQLAAEIGDKNGIFVRTDVTDEAQVKACIDTAASRFGGLHYLVSCAAAQAAFGPLETHSVEDFRGCVDLLMTGTFLAMKHATPLLKKQQGAAIVNFSSLAGLFSYGATLAYTAAKHGIIGLSKAAAEQLAPYGIRVNTVAPGWTMTPAHHQFFAEYSDAERPEAMRKAFAKKQPLRRPGAPEDLAEAVVYLLSDGARFITGQTLVVDGGLSILSRALDEPAIA
jgi:NAD(P)-dependent dehydrogenase (short-subunit alcohol dehydrogenase family)